MHRQLARTALSISDVMMVISMQFKVRGNLAILLGQSFVMIQKIPEDLTDLNSEDNNLRSEPDFRVVKKRNLGATTESSPEATR